jgi:hypothetical protein
MDERALRGGNGQTDRDVRRRDAPRPQEDHILTALDVAELRRCNPNVPNACVTLSGVGEMLPPIALVMAAATESPADCARWAVEVQQTSSLHRSLADNSSQCNDLRKPPDGTEGGIEGSSGNKEWPARQAPARTLEILRKNGGAARI